MSTMYKVCERTILRGNYPEDMEKRIKIFYKVNLITAEEYKALLNMLDKD